MKTAVVIFNLGGPLSLRDVQPFLYNLFSDPAILPLPMGLRHALAWGISKIREKKAQEIYAQLGGKSPLLDNTRAQAQALEKVLGSDYRVFPLMRYWHPRGDEVVKSIEDYSPDHIFLLPLYPQYSSTTTASSLLEWDQLTGKKFHHIPVKRLCCYPQQAGLIDAYGDLLQEKLETVKDLKDVRILFSAHGLPKKIIDSGDPYADQIYATASAVMDRLSLQSLDWRVSYQSKVGPVEWLKPYTDEEIKCAGKEGKGLVVVPIAFVSEHSETLVELDIEYKNLATEWGVPFYIRVPTVSLHPLFIKGLAALIKGETPGFECKKLYKKCYQRCGGY